MSKISSERHADRGIPIALPRTSAKSNVPENPQSDVLVAETVPDGRIPGEKVLGKSEAQAKEIEETPAQETARSSKISTRETR